MGCAASTAVPADLPRLRDAVSLAETQRVPTTPVASSNRSDSAVASTGVGSRSASRVGSFRVAAVAAARLLSAKNRGGRAPEKSKTPRSRLGREKYAQILQWVRDDGRMDPGATRDRGLRDPVEALEDAPEEKADGVVGGGIESWVAAVSTEDALRLQRRLSKLSGHAGVVGSLTRGVERRALPGTTVPRCGQTTRPSSTRAAPPRAPYPAIRSPTCALLSYPVASCLAPPRLNALAAVPARPLRVPRREARRVQGIGSCLAPQPLAAGGQAGRGRDAATRELVAGPEHSALKLQGRRLGRAPGGRPEPHRAARQRQLRGWRQLLPRE